MGSQACAKFVARASEEMGAINIYEIYADVCRDWRADADGRQLLRALAGPDDMLRQGASGLRCASAVATKSCVAPDPTPCSSKTGQKPASVL